MNLQNFPLFSFIPLRNWMVDRLHLVLNSVDNNFDRLHKFAKENVSRGWFTFFSLIAFFQKNLP